MADNIVDQIIQNYSTDSDMSVGELISTINENLPADRRVVIDTSDEEEGIQPKGRTYTKFDRANDVVIDEQIITEGMWNGQGTISTFGTASDQSTTSDDYYLQVEDGSGNEVFDVSYANITNDSASMAMYKQLRNLLLPDDDEKFTINDSDTDEIFAISIERDLYKEQIDPGNWELNVNGTTYIDDSGATGSYDTLVSGEKYGVYEGTISGGTSGTTEYGKVFLDYGLIILDAGQFTAGGASAFVNDINSFTARNQRVLKDMNYFVRLNNRDYNFSNNPTYLTGSNNERVNPEYQSTFPTTIGLYNDANELLAVARLSKPVEKSIDKEVSIKVKLSY